MHDDVSIIIPSRLGSIRLSNKPLKYIGDKKMIEHVCNQAKKTGLKNIFIATDSNEIAQAAAKANVRSIMTSPDCPSGTDRVYEAFEKMSNKEEIKYLINLQGDMPFISPSDILAVIDKLKNSNFEITTAVAKVSESTARSDSNVKVVVDANDKALYFSRSLIPYFGKEFLYHIGVYGFSKEALERFVKLPPADLEQYEKLEQLRALKNNIAIGVCYVDNVPISVDTEEDLQKAVKYYNENLAR